MNSEVVGRWRDDDGVWRPVSGCEARPRGVPKVGPGLGGAPEGYTGPPATIPEVVVGPFGHRWVRGLTYDRLRQLGEGHYPDQ